MSMCNPTIKIDHFPGFPHCPRVYYIYMYILYVYKAYTYISIHFYMYIDICIDTYYILIWYHMIIYVHSLAAYTYSLTWNIATFGSFSLHSPWFQSSAVAWNRCVTQINSLLCLPTQIRNQLDFTSYKIYSKWLHNNEQSIFSIAKSSWFTETLNKSGLPAINITFHPMNSMVPMTTRRCLKESS